MEYDLYKNVLEYIPNNIDYSKIQLDLNDKLVEEVINYTSNLSNELCIISLSGGVDSMVLTIILKLLNRRVLCLHINYNNRDESTTEAKFLHDWCKYMNIEFILHEINSIHRNDIKRNDYETKTKNIRFKFYKDILEKYKGTEIILGHHKDDIIENIFNNICRGRNILDLSVIKKINTMMGIKICRPMLEIHKDLIYKIAKDYCIPYFKDTTPCWSLRGIYRNEIYPLLDKTYSKSISKNLLNISNQSTEWDNLIEEKIIQPFMEKIYITNDFAEVDIKDNMSSPLCFWSIIFTRIFYKYGVSVATRKSIKNFINKLQDLDKKNIILNIKLSDHCICQINKEKKLKLNFKF